MSNEKLLWTAAGCLWLCCPPMVPRLTVWAYMQVFTLHIGFSFGLSMSNVFEAVKPVTAKHTLVLFMPSNHRHPLHKHQAATRETSEFGKDSYCKFNFSGRNRRYNSVYQLWRSFTAVQGCFVCWTTSPSSRAQRKCGRGKPTAKQSALGPHCLPIYIYI